MKQRFVVPAAFNLSDWRSFWRVFCFVIRKRDTAAPSLTEVKRENDGFWSSGFFGVFSPLCFVKSRNKAARRLNRNQTTRRLCLISSRPLPHRFLVRPRFSCSFFKTRMKTHQKTSVSRQACQKAYWRPNILTMCTHVRSSRQNEATCGDRTFSW